MPQRFSVKKILPERRGIMLKEIAGTRAYNILKKRKMETVEDVCQLFPSKYYDFSFISPLNTNRLDKNHAFVCKLVSYELKNSHIYIVRCTLHDIYTQNELCVSWFGTTEMYNVLKKDYHPGDTCFIGGKLKASNKKNLFFMSNPIIFKKYDEESDCHIYTAYEKIRGISESNFERIINECLEHATIPDKVPRELLHKYNLMSKDEAIREMHKPSSVEGVKKAKYRLNARAKMFDMPMPYNIIKNYTMPEAIIKDGPDKGKAKTKKIFISRTSVDEKTGKPMRSPWAIQIENGVSRPKNGGRSSVEIEPNSYQCRVRGYMRINDIDFLDFIDKAYTYMEEYRHIIAQDIVPRGEKILDEMQKRRGNTYNTVPPEEYIPESPGLVSSEQPEENFSKSSNAPVSTNSATQSNKRPQLYEVVAIIGELQGYEDYFLSNCLINNKEYLIYFYPQYITNALQEAIRLKKATNIYVYKKEKNILFYKLAAPKK